MDKVALARINSFVSQIQSNAQPSESITIPAVILQDLLGAIQELKDEVAALREERAQDHQEMATLTARMDTLTARVSSLESMEEQDISRVCLDIAQDRQRITKLEKPPEPQPTKIATTRIERIEKLCQDTPGHTISLSELRGRLGIHKSVLSRLLKKVDRGRFYLRKSSADKRVKYLCLRPMVS